MRYWIIFAITLFCTACIPQKTGTLTPEVDIAIEPFVEPTATPNTFARYQNLEFTSGEFAEGADPKGNFSFEQGGLFPPKGETSATWDIRFIHSRGVECATIILP